MSSGIHCDGPDCSTWTKIGLIQDSGFYTIFDGIVPADAYYVGHFCSWDCIMKYAATKPPLERLD